MGRKIREKGYVKVNERNTNETNMMDIADGFMVMNGVNE